MKKSKVIYAFLMVCLFFVCGCASLISRMVTSRGNVRIPQIVAHLQPVLQDNKIFVSGKIVVKNPTESDLELKQVYLTIEDEEKKVISRSVLKWQVHTVKSQQELSSPVEISLNLSVLNKKYVNVSLKTEFSYKRLGLRIPIEDKVAVLHLDALRDSIRRPLAVSVFTRFYPDLRGNVVIKYVLGITNPVSIDLLLEDGIIQIYPRAKDKSVKSFLSPTLFKAGQETQIEGVINFKKKVGARLVSEFVKGKPVKIQVSGKLSLPGTEIFMPFKVESVQELDLSLFRISKK
ncbi:MAG: hypothetical protein JSV34_01795 [Candidatus Omnitrophota bacterium]|nr:MAG: hypothetical protein JSV34_01795 [Candidatus Omnitrophota bacterium]